MQTLETRLKEAAIKNNTLLQENESLRKQVVKLETEVGSIQGTWSFQNSTNGIWSSIIPFSLTEQDPSSHSEPTWQSPVISTETSPSHGSLPLLCLSTLSTKVSWQYKSKPTVIIFRSFHRYTDLSLSSPATSTALSRIPGRALLEYREQSTHSSSSMVSHWVHLCQEINIGWVSFCHVTWTEDSLAVLLTYSPLLQSQDKQHSKEHHALQQPPGPTHKASSTSALVPVFTAVPSTLDQKMNELRRLREALPCPPPASSVCSCPAQNKSNNYTALRM